jgi:flagellar hook-basal body complex protein FliE
MKVGGVDLPGIEPVTSGIAPARGGGEFGKALKEALTELEKVQGEADKAVTRFAAGEDVDLHTVLLQVQKAELSFRLMLEVRNKLIDAYREVMRMSV